MSQSDMVIADQPGASFLADLNSAIAALATNSSGTTEPATTYAYQVWADTTADRLKIRNAANDGWVSWLVLSTGAPVSGVSAGPITASGLTQSTARMLGRSTAGTGAVEEISLGSGLSLTAGVLDVATPPVVSMVRVNTANGYGSTNTAIKRYATVVATQGTDITYADSATLGASFTINTAGVYSLSGNVIAAATSSLGASLNSSQLTSVIGSITAADRLIAGYGAGGNPGTFSVSVYLPAGSVIRPHSDGNASTSAAAENFTVTRIC